MWSVSTSQPTVTLDLTPTRIHLALIVGPGACRASPVRRSRRLRTPGRAAPPVHVSDDLGDTRQLNGSMYGRQPRPPSSTRGGTCRACATPALFGPCSGGSSSNSARSSMRGRRRRVVREIPVSVLPEEGSALASREVDHADRTASLDRLERALERLALGERTVLWLHHYEGLSLADVGSRMGVPPKTVKSRLVYGPARARARPDGRRPMSSNLPPTRRPRPRAVRAPVTRAIPADLGAEILAATAAHRQLRHWWERLGPTPHTAPAAYAAHGRGRPARRGASGTGRSPGGPEPTGRTGPATRALAGFDPSLHRGTSVHVSAHRQQHTDACTGRGQDLHRDPRPRVPDPLRARPPARRRDQAPSRRLRPGRTIPVRAG